MTIKYFRVREDLLSIKKDKDMSFIQSLKFFSENVKKQYIILFVLLLVLCSVPIIIPIQVFTRVIFIQILYWLALTVLIYLLYGTPFNKMIKPDKLDEALRRRTLRYDDTIGKIIECLEEHEAISLNAVMDLQSECRHEIESGSKTFVPFVLPILINLLIVIPASAIINIVANPNQTQNMNIYLLLFIIGSALVATCKIIESVLAKINGVSSDRYVLTYLQEAKYYLYCDNEKSQDK